MSGHEHDELVNHYYKKAASLDPLQLQHVLRSVVEHALFKLKGADRERAIKDLKVIIKRCKAGGL